MMRYFILLGLMLGSATAFAAGGVVNWYEQAYQLVSGHGYDHHAAERFVVIAGGVFTMAVCTIVGVLYKRSVANLGDDVAPDGKFSLRTVVDMAMDLVVGLSKDNLGDQWRVHAP
jgi:hypothetical protein